MYDDDFMEGEEEFEDTMQDKYLSFMLMDNCYLLAIENVIEIVSVQQITHVPEMEHFVKGVIDLRGMVIPLIDARLLFQLPEVEYNDRTSIIITSYNDKKIGIIVDYVKEVQDIHKENFSAPLSIGTSIDRKYIKGIGKTEDGVKLLLNLESFLDTPEYEAIEV